MKILQLRSSDLFSSPERLIIGQCRYLTDYEFVCASFSRHGHTNRFLKECEAAGITTEHIPESCTGDIRVIGHIRKLITKHAIDLVVTHDYKSNLYGHLASKKPGVEHIAYFHGRTSEDAKVKLYNLIDWCMLRRITRVITVSELTKQLMVDKGVAADKISVVVNGVDPEMLSIKNRPPHDERSLCDENAVRQIVAAGRFSHEKGFDILLEAIHRIKDQSPPFVLHLYGLGPTEDSLRSLTNRLGLDDVVRFCGFVDDILPVFREMDFLVLSSRSEGMPVVVLEAWSQQLGVVATRVGGIPEMIEDGRDGLLVNSEDIQGLSQKILWGLTHVDEMSQFGVRGYELVKERYNYAAQAEALREVYGATGHR